MGLIGRSRELAVVADLLAGARRSVSGSLVLVGEPGIGKSALLAEAIASAEGMLVLEARGIESELELPCGVLGRLLRPIRDLTSDASIASGHEEILAAVLEPGRGAPPIQDRFAAGAATLSLLAAASEDRPVLVVVDDTQWADDASIGALSFVAHRLLAEGVALLLSRRAGRGAEALDWLPSLELSGLDEDAARQLLTARGVTVAGADRVHRLVAATGGNPLALIELPHLVDTPLDEIVARGPIPIGQRLERAYGERVEALPPRSRDALLVAATLDEPEGLTLHRALDALGLSVEDLAAAEEANLISLAHGIGTFRHPLVRSAVAQLAASPRRRMGHAAAAAAFARSSDPDDEAQRAWHLAAAAAGLDDVAADLLERTGERARSAGGYAAAAGALARAAELTTDEVVRHRRFLAAAEAAYQSANNDRAEQLVVAAERTGVGGSTAEIARLRGRLETARGFPDRAFALLERAADDADDAVAAELLLEAVMAAAFWGDNRKTLRAAERVHQLTTAEGANPVTALVARLAVGAANILRGDTSRGLPYLDDGELLLGVIDRNLDALTYLASIAFCHVVAGELERAERYASAVVASATSQGVTAAIPFALVVLANVDYRNGACNAAVARGLQALDLATTTGRLHDRATAHATLAIVAAMQGRVDDCRHHAAASEQGATETGSLGAKIRGFSALGLLELGLGRPSAAIEQLQKAEAMCRELELLDLCHYWAAADSVEAHVQLGHREEALATLELLEWQATRTKRPITVGHAARCRGLVLADARHDDHFHEAIAAHEAAGQPFELARTHLCYGTRLRRLKSRALARQQLEIALSIFVQLDASSWADRARTELAACGVKFAPSEGRLTDTLTSQELQIATAVASGATNADVAAHLFISRKTVEYHLSSIYRKLNVDARGQLSTLLATGGSRAV